MEISEFYNLVGSVWPADGAAARASWSHWNSLAKPIGGLGLLEDYIVRIAALTGTEDVHLGKRAVFVSCADNGVVEEGVTQTGPEVTAVVAGNLAKGDTSVCRMASVANCDVVPVDMGMFNPVEDERVLRRRIAAGTGNIAMGPAMTREDALKAIIAGVELVKEYKDKGYGIIATGEMGIGNTTSSSAVASVLLDRPVPEVTGRGAGLSDEGLRRKISAIERAIEINRPDPSDSVDVLMKVGGFDIAAMTGTFLGGAIYRVPIIVDGFISAVSALIAKRICPNSICAIFASHVSAEPASMAVLDALGLTAPITAGLRLGEGTGAVALLPLLDMSLSVYHGMCTFDDTGIEAYTPQGGF
jgi:nicotinate-nucleotide--dimethylbenzimidazole phosphoribosyltransferase